MKKVLLTGGNGFIAKHILVDLVNAGYSVNVTLRDPSVVDILKQNLKSHIKTFDQVQFFEADLELDQGWSEAIKGCEGIIHTASPTPMSSGNDIESYLLASKDGTLRILKLALEQKVSRIVITSSIAALIYQDNRESVHTFNEESRSDPTMSNIGLYGQSKTITDNAVWSFAKENKMTGAITCIYPGLVLGPCLDARLNISTLYLNQLLNGAFPLAPNFSWPIVDVRDVSKIHLMAVHKPRFGGEKVILGEGSYSLLDISDIIKDKFPQFKDRLPKGELPEFLSKLLGYIDPKIKNVLGDLGVQLEANNKLSKSIVGDIELIDPEESIIDTVNSLIKMKLVN